MYARGKTYRARLLVIVTTERERKRLCTPTRSIALRSLIAAKIIARRHFESVDQPPLLLLIWFTFLLYLKASAIFSPSLPPSIRAGRKRGEERASEGGVQASVAERHALLVRPTRESQYPKRIRDIPINAIGLSGIRSVVAKERETVCLPSPPLHYTTYVWESRRFDALRDRLPERYALRLPVTFHSKTKPHTIQLRSLRTFILGYYLYSKCKLFRRTTVRLSFVWVSFESFRIFIQIYVFVFRSLMFVRRGNE